MTDELQQICRQFWTFLRMSPAEKAALFHSSEAFPELPHDSGSREILDLEANGLLCIAVEADDYHLDAFIGVNEPESEEDQCLRAVKAGLSILLENTFFVIKAENQLLKCWTAQGLSDGVWLMFSIIASRCSGADDRSAKNLPVIGDSFLERFVPEKGTLRF